MKRGILSVNKKFDCKTFADVTFGDTSTESLQGPEDSTSSNKEDNLPPKETQEATQSALDAILTVDEEKDDGAAGNEKDSVSSEPKNDENSSVNELQTAFSESVGVGEVIELNWGKKSDEDNGGEAENTRREPPSLGYKADDAEDSSRAQEPQDGAGPTEPPSLSNILRNLLSLPEIVKRPASKPFDPQDLLLRIREKPLYAVNASWIGQHEVLGCSAQPFLQRVTMSGEFFGVS